jgi:membrane-associated phospholipid phosphatase
MRPTSETRKDADRRDDNHALKTAAVATLAAAGFGWIASAVAQRKTAKVDHHVHRKVTAPEDHPVRAAAEAAAPIGKWWTYLPAALLTGSYVVIARSRDDDSQRSPVAGMTTIVAAACIAAAVNKQFDKLLPQPPAPPGRPTPDHPVFPSGHAFGTAAVALSAAYVITREELAPAAVAFPVAMLVPIGSSVARLMEEKHWISDVLGGHLAAIALASICLTGYEACR